MNSIFSYESTPMQILMYIGDLIILNFLYLICCIPIFTIGAAQAGLYSGVKVLQDKEDDSSPAAAFGKGFINGFGKVTLAWDLLLVVMAVLVCVGVLGYQFGLPVWLCVAPVCICALFQSLVPAFHSRFGCTAMQLIRNSWFLIVAHPLRSLGVFIVTWLPMAVFLFGGIFYFMALTPIWGTLYFSTAFLFGYKFLNKPFNTLIENFNEANAAKEASEEAGEETPV